jgi:hypothetical protein
MKFVLVNERTPRGAPTCARCGTPIATGYLRDLSSQQPYCDHACFLGRKMAYTPTLFRFGGGIDSLQFSSLIG